MAGRALKERLIRLLILIVGLTIAHFGVTIFMLVSLGADPFNVLIQGLSSHIPISHGMTHMGICFLIILLLLFFGKSYVKLGTFVCMALGGPIIDVFTLLLGDSINGDMPMSMRIVLVIIACFILAFGMTLVIQSDAGTGPNDLIAVVISDKLAKNFGVVRVIVDVSLVAVGVVLGGTFGVGTLICASVVGIVAGAVMPFSKKIVSAILR